MRKLLAVLLVAASVPLYADSSVKPVNILANPGCEKVVTKNGKTQAEKIGAGHYSGSKGKFSIDNESFKSGKYSARLEKNNVKGWSGIVFKSRTIPALKEKTKFKVNLNLQAENVSHGNIVIQGYNKSRKNCFWKEIYSFKGTFEWREIMKTIEVPKDTMLLYISVRLNKGNGTVWADDCAIVEVKEDAKVKSNSIEVPNSGFEQAVDQATGISAHWKRRTFEGFETSADIKTVASSAEGKKAVMLAWKSGGTKFGIETAPLPVKAKKRINFSVKFRTENEGQAALQVEAFDKKGQLLEQFTSPAKTSEKWTDFTFPVSLPDETQKVKLCCVLLGKGKVWYDNIRLGVRAPGDKNKKSIYFEAKCYPINSVQVWNNGKALFHTFADSPCSLTFHFKGIKKKLKNPALIIELPEEVKLEECFNTHEDIPGGEIPEVYDFLWRGKKYKRYIFRNARIFRVYIRPGYAYGRKLTMALSPVSRKLIGKKVDAFWYLENNKQCTAKNHFEIKFLEPLPKLPNPSDFYVSYWGNPGMMFSNQELFSRVKKKYKEANMIGRDRKRSFIKQDNELANAGWKLFTPIWALDYTRRVKELRKIGYKGKSYSRMMDSGKIDTHKLCPHYFNRDPELKKYAKKLLRKKLEIIGTKDGETVCLDSEPWSPHTWCYCENCRNEFAKRFNLKNVPSTVEIKAKYSTKWRDFRVEQSTATTKIYNELLKEVLPKSKLLDYDYPINFSRPDYRKAFDGCSKDPLSNEKYIDGHVSSYYHHHGKKAFDLIRINMNKLKKDYSPILAIDGPGSYLNSSEIVSPAQFKLTMLAAAALGCKSVWIYSESETDGLFYQEINKGMAEIAVLQKFFKQGRLEKTDIKITGLPYSARKIGKNIYKRPNWDNHLSVTVHQLKAQKLISLFNFHPQKAAFVKVEVAGIKSGEYFVTDPITKKQIGRFSAQKLKSGFLCKVPAESSRELLISKEAPVGKITDGASQSSLLKEYQKAVAGEKKNASKTFRPIFNNKMSIQPGELADETEEILQINTPSQKLWLGIGSGGTVKKWQAENKELCGKGAEKSFLLCQDRLWLPQEMKGILTEYGSYRIKEAHIRDSAAIVVLSFKDKKKKIELLKTFKIKANSPEFKVSYAVKNISNSNLVFSFWLHNFIDFDDTKYFIPSSKKIVSLKNQRGDKIFPVSGIKEYYGFKQKNIGGTLKENWASCLFPDKKSGLLISTDLEKIMLLYEWNNRTIEWICRKIDLQPDSTWTNAFDYKFYVNTANNSFFK